MSPCALAISTTANACLSSQGIWSTPVPLGVAAGGIWIAFVVGALVVLATQAVCCSCLVGWKIAIWSFVGHRQHVEQAPILAQPLVVQDVGSKNEKIEAPGPQARGRGVPQLRRGRGALA